ncbi:Syntaxin-5 [Chionoecetes opilio]|uniref:Syntaxin-5 n=1 Tax=Chionoecetes opilio TaxID=41210 RepID=A0A8J4Y802_CHIOP|nr:Syntaxin-5 [Chionoecetes opilio]
MTTRRRRAGSESLVEEPTAPGVPVFLNPTASPLQLQPDTPQTPYTLFPQVVIGGNNTNGPEWGSPSAQAYYKKTDSVDPALRGQPGGGQVTQVSQSWSSPQLQTPSYQPQDQSHWSSGNSYQPCVDDSEMACRDRTQEFSRIVRSQQGSSHNGSVPHRDSKRPRDLRQYQDFMQRSRLIGRNISSTYAKLEKMTHLAKKRSLFDDSHDSDIQELTGIIRHDLSSLTKQLGDLRTRSLAASPGGSSAHLQKHSSNLVGTLQTKVAFITQKFRDVLEVRTENLKKQAERRDHFTGGVVSGELPPAAMAGHHQGSVLLAAEVAAAAVAQNPGRESNRLGGGEVAINFETGNAYQQQLQLMEEQDTYLQSRADTMRTIESTIVELGQMFNQLASMVKEQEELVHRIDTNVDDAEMNVEAAHHELLKYFKSVSSNRMLMIKVFGIMIVFFVIFVVFMA